MLLSDPFHDAVLRGAVLAIIALLWVTLLIRINGLRSLSKMTSFDFVMTVALGSLVAGVGQASDWSGFAQALTAMAGLFLAQFASAWIRKRSDAVEDFIQNEPVLLMKDGKICSEAMKRARVSESDLRAKLREANVLDFTQVRAAVLETTGDVSVLHGDYLAEELLEGVRNTD